MYQLAMLEQRLRSTPDAASLYDFESRLLLCQNRLKPKPKLWRGGARRSADELRDVTDALTFCRGSTLATLPPEPRPLCHCCLPLHVPRWVKPSHSSGQPHRSASGQQLATDTLSVHKPDNLYTGLLWTTRGGRKGGVMTHTCCLGTLTSAHLWGQHNLARLFFRVFSCVRHRMKTSPFLFRLQGCIQCWSVLFLLTANSPETARSPCFSDSPSLHVDPGLIGSVETHKQEAKQSSILKMYQCTRIFVSSLMYIFSLDGEDHRRMFNFQRVFD